mgnify:CR=1 FL=1
MAGAVPYVAINFTLYENIKVRFSEPGQRPSQAVSLVAGGVAGGVAMTLTYSFELVRRRMV